MSDCETVGQELGLFERFKFLTPNISNSCDGEEPGELHDDGMEIRKNLDYGTGKDRIQHTRKPINRDGPRMYIR